MLTILSMLCLCSAAFFKAVADTLTHHFDTSVFKCKDRRWWDPAISWQHVGLLRFTKYRPDAWHLANSGMIICFIACAVLHRPLYLWWIELAIGGTLYNVAFNLFYNKILRRK